MNRTAEESAGRPLELRFIRIYFWAFWLQCIQVTFLNLYLRRRGFSGTEIGMLGSVSALTGLFLAPLIGIRFDSAHNRPGFLSLLAATAGLAFASFSLPLPASLLVPSAMLLSASWMPLAPLIDSLAFSKSVLSAASRGYGGYRRWGSVGFVVAGLAVGALASFFGLDAIFPAYVACALGVSWLVTGIPRTAIPAGDKTLRARAVLDLLRIPQYRRFLAIYLVSSVGSAACFPFRAIYLSSLGVPETAIGALYILPIAAEVVCFSYSQKLLARFGPIPLIAAGPLFASARWWLLSYMRYSPLLFVTEILHGLSFAVFYAGALSFVMQAVPHRLRGTAQVLFFSSTMALGRAIGTFAGGRMFDLLGVVPMLRIGGSLPALAALLHVLSARSGAYRLKEPTPPAEEAPAETAQS